VAPLIFPTQKDAMQVRMEISVENLQKKILLNPPQLIKVVQAVLHKEGIQEAYLAIVFVTSQKIRALNWKFLKRKHTTDVLAFDLRGNGSSKESKSKSSYGMAGDVVVSTDAVIQNAARFGTSVAYELTLYVVHGILHLLGYDDHDPHDTKKMRQKEKEILDFLGGKVDPVIL